MGTAHWNGIHLSQLLAPRQVQPGTRELAVAGVDGHVDSFALVYAFSNETMFALGMNGRTLNRAHNFHLRLLAPIHYGFKNVKWISELAFVSGPCFGTWPNLGYTKVQVRADQGPWIDAVLEAPLSEHTLARWYAEIPGEYASKLPAIRSISS